MNFKLLSVLLILFCSSLIAQNPDRSIAIFDLTEVNGETNNSRLNSIEHLMEIAGIPYITTTDLAIASQYSMILCTSALRNSTLNAEEEASLENYVFSGGVFFAPRIENDDLWPIFGLTGFEKSSSRYRIKWDSTMSIPSFRWIDEPEERTISLGRSTYEEIYKTLGYQTGTAETLASFEDGTAAITRNKYGQGTAISIGLSWRDVIMRNQINRDFEAQRISSNGFEPTTDVFMLFVRGIYAELNPYTVWKNTSPGNSSATLMITHDIDSRTGMDTMHYFVDYEKAENIVATYNVTLRYFADTLMSDFYNSRQDELEYILARGHKVQSHSVGHFIDFSDEDAFPLGSFGNTRENYTPFNDGSGTLGGSVYGECEVSKKELEKDLGIHVRTFRSGHLVYPKKLLVVLDALDYEYNSSSSACDVLTHFPYQGTNDRSFSGSKSGIYELPVTISDVFHDDPISLDNYLEKAEHWLKITRQNAGNNAPTVLLIHPNRQYKLEGLNYYLESLEGENILKMEMGEFGDFWKARKAFEFDSELSGDTLMISINSTQNLEDNVSFIVNDGLELSEIVVNDESGNVLDFIQESWEENDVILYAKEAIVSSSTSTFYQDELKVFPNPVESSLSIEFQNNKSEEVEIRLFNIEGGKVLKTISRRTVQGQNTWKVDLSDTLFIPGLYFIVLENESGKIWKRTVIKM